MAEPDLTEWLRQLFASGDDRAAIIREAWRQLDAAGLVSKVTVHRYLCGQCASPLVTVIRLGDNTIAHVRDYKQSPGMNRKTSAPAARGRHTLDGDRHWPAHAYDISQLADFGPGAGFLVACRHVTTTLRAVDVLEVTRNVRPGHPGAPTRL